MTGFENLSSVYVPEAIRDSAERLAPGMKETWKDGAKTFFKGTNDRWKDVFSAEELSLYNETADRVLPPDCRAWLENGRVAL